MRSTTDLPSVGGPVGAPFELPSLDAPLNVCYWSAQPEESKRVDAPPVMLIHGFDSSVLEFRFVIPALVEAGLEVSAASRRRARANGSAAGAPASDALGADRLPAVEITLDLVD